jgi:dihydrofolate synthase/folylpolyglutamate synthase
MTQSPIQDYDQAIEYLHGRINYERMSVPLAPGDFKLDRMRNLLGHLGNPHLKIPAVHIAGTKGKGTTATIVSEILQAAGFQVGLFTSPHLHHYEERIRINSTPILRDKLVSLTRHIEQVVATIDATHEKMRPTFFEVTTALAWLCFEQTQVDIAVLEVGLGGRLDSTNLCVPEVCVITTISKDHTEVLGDQLSQIAVEKAGIIKPQVPIVCGVTSAAVQETIAKIARERDAPLIQIGRDLTFDITSAELDRTELTIRSDRSLVKSSQNSDSLDEFSASISLPLTGSHQAHNAACAIAAIQVLAQRDWRVTLDAIESGCRSVDWPARVEVLSRQPLVVLDAAHNPASVEALLQTLSKHEVAGRKTLIYSSTQDKPVEELLRMLMPHFDCVILTQFQSNPRALQLEALHEIGIKVNLCPTRAIKSAEEAWATAFSESQADGLICIAGSFFLAADLRPRLIRDLQSVP